MRAATSCKVRASAAGVDPHLVAVGLGQDALRVAGGARQWDVAGDGGDGDDLDLLRRAQRQEDRQGVVLAGVAVEDDLVLGHISLQ